MLTAKITAVRANILPVLPNARLVTATTAATVRRFQPLMAAKNILPIALLNARRLMVITAVTGFINPVIMAVKSIIRIAAANAKVAKHVQTPVTAATVTVCRNASATSR